MQKLKRLRIAKGWSQMELSRRSKVSQSFIHDLEAGTKNPTTVTLNKLAEALGVSITELLKDEETNHKTKPA